MEKILIGKIIRSKNISDLNILCIDHINGNQLVYKDLCNLNGQDKGWLALLVKQNGIDVDIINIHLFVRGLYKHLKKCKCNGVIEEIPLE